MKSEGQGTLEYLLLIGGAVLIAVIVIALVLGIGSQGTRVIEDMIARYFGGGSVVLSPRAELAPMQISGEFSGTLAPDGKLTLEGVSYSGFDAIIISSTPLEIAKSEAKCMTEGANTVCDLSGFFKNNPDRKLEPGIHVITLRKNATQDEPEITKTATFVINPNREKECETDNDCAGKICPAVVGGNKPKCDLTTKTCYCGGICGDEYCDPIERRDKSCSKDCDKCYDGTPFGQCSITKPKYCQDGELVDNCSFCSCPGGQQCQADGSCIVPLCSDGTPFGQCSATKPQYCDSGTLVNKCSFCGCPEGQACQADESCKAVAPEAYFKFDYPPRSETFIFKLTNPEKIQEARDILARIQTDATHVMGIIKDELVDYNPPYNYHLNPSSISFFENSMELCDAGIFESYPEEYCNQYPPGECQWCPWGSRLIEEVTVE